MTDSAAPEPRPVKHPPGRRPSLDDVFGEVLPDVTDDERSTPDADGRNPDSWYHENRPPHHDPR